MQKFIIPGKLDGLNKIILANRTNKYAGAALKRQNEKVVALAIAAARIKPIPNPVFIKFFWYEPNKKRDKDNIASAKKMIIDALVRSGIIQNDGWKYIIGFSDSFDIDKDNPRIEVELYDRTI